METLKGTWRFNLPLSLPKEYVSGTRLDYVVKFTAIFPENYDIDSVNCDYFSIKWSTSRNRAYLLLHPHPSAYFFEYDSTLDDDHNFRGVIDFDGVQNVTSEFYEWFTANAVEVEQKTIKAGTYRFNDVLPLPEWLDRSESFDVDIPFKTTLYADLTGDGYGIINAEFMCSRIKLAEYGPYEEYDPEQLYIDVHYCAESSSFDFASIGEDVSFPTWGWVYCGEPPVTGDGWKKMSTTLQTITVTEDTEVSDEFYEWFTANAVEQKQISGVWKFNDVLVDLPYVGVDAGIGDYISQNIAFTTVATASDETNVYSVRSICSEIIAGNHYIYGPEMYYCVESLQPSYNDNLPQTYCVYREEWYYGDGSKTLNFGTEPQYVSIDFYNWFTVNATPIIQFNITENGTTTLATAWKYCDRNIDVSVDVGDNRIDELVQGTISGWYVSDKVTSVKDYAFYVCKSLSNVRLPNCTIIGGSSFSVCSNLESVDLPMCTNIKGNGAFRDCSKLKTINIPNVTTITDGSRTFFATILEEVDLPNLTSIGTSTLRMFANNDYLKKVSLPKLSGTTISSYTFYSDDSLKTLILGGSELNPLENVNAFENASIRYRTGYVYVPDDLVDTYKTATNWVAFADQIKPMSELGE